MQNKKETIYQLETSLLSPQVRHSKKMLEKVISEDFTEIGKSGTIYQQTELIEALINTSDRPFVMIKDFEISSLSKEVVLATYKSVNPKDDSITLRSSIWIKQEDEWRMRFHQGTPIHEKTCN